MSVKLTPSNNHDFPLAKKVYTFPSSPGYRIYMYLHMTINLPKCLVQSMKISRLISFFRTHTNRYKENTISINILGDKKKQHGIYTLFNQPNRRDNVHVDK